ncbi:uncharacterized protein LOC143179452 [Calliopsis andreniformis]|uniref:uncharacterized protein LOC143179452 n=1 Tax=Calliopsis andreniformis TaxID=337506 RepID=UPI003FCCA6BC
MKTSAVLLLIIAASASAAPIPSNQNSLRSPRNQDIVPVSTEAVTVIAKDATNQPVKKQSRKPDSGTKDSKGPLLTSILSKDDRAKSKPDVLQKHPNESKDRTAAKRSRKHKAIFVNYPLVQQLPFSGIPYDVDFNSNSFDSEETSEDSNGYQESNIFFIRLPPTPYMFVPGLGYISQPPTYSTSKLRPQHSYSKPARPKPTYQPGGNPFIKLPIDFVSNGKPTSVYQWQKKHVKKPTDSPITNLDSLSSEFVSNGKPTSIYQWQSNLQPVKGSDDLVNNLNKGPYTFNGKPSSFFLLKSDGSSSPSQPLRYPEYREDNSYY